MFQSPQEIRVPSDQVDCAVNAVPDEFQSPQEIRVPSDDDGGIDGCHRDGVSISAGDSRAF